MGKHEPGLQKGTVICPVSKRTEGTVRMEGRVCSFCGKPVNQ